MFHIYVHQQGVGFGISCGLSEGFLLKKYPNISKKSYCFLCFCNYEIEI